MGNQNSWHGNCSYIDRDTNKEKWLQMSRNTKAQKRNRALENRRYQINHQMRQAGFNVNEKKPKRVKKNKKSLKVAWKI